jgi:glutamine phosphoribosylpyrophosphate amidotransferase
MNAKRTLVLHWCLVSGIGCGIALSGPALADTPTREELIASSQSREEIRAFLAADSIAYLSQEGLYAFRGGEGNGFCDACFTGRYRVPLVEEGPTRQLHLFEAHER